jgi:hypothetical protein
MFRHLQFVLIGAAALVTSASVIAAVVWAFTMIPNYPYARAIVVAVLLSWGIGFFITDNLK